MKGSSDFSSKWIFYLVAGCFYAGVFLGSYALTTRRTQATRLQNQALAGQLEAANQQLRDYSAQLGQLAVARERN